MWEGLRRQGILASLMGIQQHDESMRRSERSNIIVDIDSSGHQSSLNARSARRRQEDSSSVSGSDSGLDQQLIKAVEAVVKGESTRIKALGSQINVRNMKFLISSFIQPGDCYHTTRTVTVQVEQLLLTCSDFAQDGEERGAAMNLLCQFLRQHRDSIHTILFSRNEFGNEHIGQLLPVFYKNQTLIELNLSTNQIHGAAGGAVIRALLEKNKHMKKLTLWNNPLGDEGAHALAPGLVFNTSLEQLDLGICKLGDEGLAVIVNALTARRGGMGQERGSRTSRIKSLDLHANNLTRQALSSLTMLLSSVASPRIESLDAWHMPDLLRDPKRVRAFAHALTRNSSLRRLNLRESGMNDQAALCLFPALEINNTIDFVNVFCDREQLGPIGCQQLLKSISELKPRHVLCHATFWSQAGEFLAKIHKNMHLQVVTGVHVLGKDNQDKVNLVLDRNKLFANAVSLVNAPTEIIPLGIWPLALGKMTQVNKRANGVAIPAIFEMLQKGVAQWI